MFPKRSKSAITLVFYIVFPQFTATYDNYHRVYTNKFKWPVWDSFYDCIVGIYVDGKPTGLGVFIRPYAVITSANPFGRTSTFNYEPDPSIFEVYAINGSWNKAVKLEVDLVSRNQLDRNRAWVKVGFDHLHTTIYDFVTITFQFARVQGYWANRDWSNRVPYYVSLYRPLRIKPYSPYGWKYAAFGFVDKPHIEKSLDLVKADYSWEAVLEDCDEWIPRPWGHFICLANIDNYMGIQSGAPLFHGNELYGLGAFELNRGNESILVFSELKPYVEYDSLFYFYSVTESLLIPWRPKRYGAMEMTTRKRK